MLKRYSFVWKKPGLSDDDFKSIWLGDHATAAKRLAGLRAYTIAFLEPSEPDLPDAVATTVFDSREACEAAFSDKELVEELFRTREEFAARTVVVFGDEVDVLGAGQQGGT